MQVLMTVTGLLTVFGAGALTGAGAVLWLLYRFRK